MSNLINSAPAYFIYLLAGCRSSKSFFGFSLTKLFKLAGIVVGVFALSFGPFIYQLHNVLQRLFPFKRGLTHAYWAPNFWAIYNTADRFASLMLKKMDANFVQKCNPDSGSTSTKGLVTDTFHCVLPNIPPIVSLALTVFALMPVLWKLWFHRDNPVQFLRALILCNFTAFMFGW